ncbi:hypothetical protein J2X31_003642 [Flavobacterium arsenatis]|uniref:Uncharacterized protein n=1 Tax=Flavobacterium arsenatis TaxID=1484332 RepID=A0ABU1TUQ0_9FLAO|nr:hypothetical protein [Flavobacterium arsenatis]MDR6969609.1 hypothetical protein [Flavobacterium arsenatis]
MKTKILFFLMALPFFGIAQTQNFRKAILKSDLIISINDYSIDTVRINDFTSKQYINIDKINEGNAWVYKNNLPSVPKKLSLRKFEDGEDFYSYLITNDGACIHPAYRAHEQFKTYHDLFFIKKTKNEYQIVMFLQSLEWEQLKIFEQQIKSFAEIEKIKNEKERYQKSLDWFIENGLMPDNDFVDYYKQKGITKDTIQYSEQQYKNALQQLQKGKEDLLPMVRKKYFENIKQYYTQKLEAILKIEKPEYKDYYNFDKAFRSIVEELDYDSADYLLYNALTSDKFDQYDKRKMMQHLLEVAKNWELSED